ncbi:DUF397 domain-containing protein [Streptomyces noursei]|uniref:DUF397 domain-containing protein n=1 Tax=Streptomyces noursei TaxID=1971 RepID=UPI00081D2071|nr:protein of unknown function (DUF397) [Streptomyces noursei ATCC 11455]MCZ0995013.1 DUF397 domain-containing protein [Streptomyces noursei]
MATTDHSLSDASTLTGWFKSSYSGPSNGDCLEVAAGHAHVPVRDSKRPTGPALLFPAASWADFVSAVRRGEFGASSA